MIFKLGLTGSIGMGKSTTAKLFAEYGCAVWDADAAVHRLYATGGAAVGPIGRAFPLAIVDGTVSRDRLKEVIADDPDALQQIERIVHPLVADDRTTFLSGTDADVTVFDIPLLFETGADAQMDATACVTVAPETQKARVMERGTMSEAQFQAILSKQMPDAEKRTRADYVIVTDTLEHARAQVQDVLKEIRDRQTHA
ncbi:MULTISPECIES: dephospho-CoA kinase [unclassified Roseovarius]|uniref:dephospho-CoA kinase n=1 Tax=unclassified Roseovarius TaxID=2614913 RepID=UPI0027402A15|nr:dephospho-CoA kinase [Roseovarius sp. MMSF_3350]